MRFTVRLEKRDNPDLHDQPVIVGGGERGGGGGLLCGAAVWYLLGHADLAGKACLSIAGYYQAQNGALSKIGRQIQMMQQLTPLVQPLSIDEAFLIWLERKSCIMPPPALSLARLQKQIKEELRLTVSVGLAANKSMAKNRV